LKKCLVISDMHFDIFGKEDISDYIEYFSSELIKYINDNKINLLLIAGDICKDIGILSSFFGQLERISIPIVYVVGNHELGLQLFNNITDYMIISEGSYLEDYIIMPNELNIKIDSFFKLKKIEQIIKSKEIFLLHDEPIIIKDISTIIIGNSGWYNYQFPFIDGYSPKIEDENNFLESYFNTDGSLKNNIDFARFFNMNYIFWNYLFTLIKYQIEKIKNFNYKKYKNLLFLSHYIPITKCIPLKINENTIDELLISNADSFKWYYSGVFNWIQKNKIKIDYYIFGHTHKENICLLSKENKYINNPFCLSRRGKLYVPQNDLIEYFKKGTFNLK